MTHNIAYNKGISCPLDSCSRLTLLLTPLWVKLDRQFEVQNIPSLDLVILYSIENARDFGAF